MRCDLTKHADSASFLLLDSMRSLPLCGESLDIGVETAAGVSIHGLTFKLNGFINAE